MTITNPITTALCSFGMSGKLFHAPFVEAHPGFQLYAAWERSKSIINTIYPTAKSVAYYEDLLRDPAIELIIVNTPNYTHFDFAKAALEAGKHVIVEKPFTITEQEGHELTALGNRLGRVLSVYQNRRYDSDYKTVKKIVEEGLLGDIVEAEFHFDRYKEELSPKVHKETPGPGTGALYDLGSHLIDQALQLFGLPTAVFADIQIVRPISQVDDYFEVLLYYPSLRVRVRSSYLVREPLPGYILHGSKGSFIKHKTNVQEEALQAGLVPGTEGWGIEPETERGFLHTEKEGLVIKEHVPSLTGNYATYFDGIYNAIRNNEAPPVTGTEGSHVIRVIEKAFQSSKERRVVEF
jgi:scyllo-inositol 2-dehydrogenase (NADP+)